MNSTIEKNVNIMRQLTTTLNCNKVAKKDPCFATYACICDNNFSQISSLMPQIPIEQQTVTITVAETRPEPEEEE